MNIPPKINKVFIQPNNTEVGNFTNNNYPTNLYATFNCDLTENAGRIRLGKRMLINTSTADVAEITNYPIGFRYFNGSFYTAAGYNNVGYVFKGGSQIASAFTKVTGGGAPTTIDSETSDMETAFDKLFVSSASDGKVYYSSDGTTWSNLTAGGAGYTVMMTAYANRMYATKNGNSIQSWDSGLTVASSGQYTLTLGNGEIITWLRNASNKIWIGTVNQYGGKGYIYEWDGASAQPTKSYRLESAGALACVIKDDVPYVIDANGNLIWWNGGTFKKLTSIYRKKNKPLFNPFYKINQRFVHPNGMALIRNEIHILLDLTNYDVSSHNGTQEDCNPSGIWRYDETTKSLTHKYSFGLSKSSDSITDYGQERIYGAGALAESITAQAPITWNGTFLAGATFYTDATTTKSAIFYDDNNDTLQKAGKWTFLKIESPNVTEIWQSVYGKIKKFENATDKIVFKMRTYDMEPVEATITWTSSTTFTVPNSSVVVSNYWTSGTGGEVEVVQGGGSGMCAHITNAVLATGTWTVTVDETFPVTSGTSKARFTNFAKMGSINDVYKTFTNLQHQLSVTSTWVQYKIWAIWTGRGEFEELITQNTASQGAK